MNGKIVCTVLVMTLALLGCKSENNASSNEAATTASEASEAPEATAEAAPTEAAPAAENAATKEVEKPTENVDEAPTEKVDEATIAARAKLEKAYKEVYCAHQTGRTEKLLEVYKRHGFEDPKAWTVAWTEAAKDNEWVSELTHKTMTSKCP
jgi:hypothetical protein